MEMAKAAVAEAGGMELKAESAPREPGPLAAAAKKIAVSDAQSALVLGSPRFNVDGIAELRKMAPRGRSSRCRTCPQGFWPR